MTDDCTFLDKDTSFRGEICTREIIVEGSVCGEVSASDTVMIRNGATVDGPIRTARILLEEGGEHLGKVNFDTPARPHAARSFISRLFGTEATRQVSGRPALSKTFVPLPSSEPVSGSVTTEQGTNQADPPGGNSTALPEGRPEKSAPETDKTGSWSEQLW